MVDLPEAESPVNHRVHPRVLRAFQRSSRERLPACQWMLVDLVVIGIAPGKASVGRTAAGKGKQVRGRFVRRLMLIAIPYRERTPYPRLFQGGSNVRPDLP